jgi:hypothetical protein
MVVVEPDEDRAPSSRLKGGLAAAYISRLSWVMVDGMKRLIESTWPKESAHDARDCNRDAMLCS